MTEPTPAPVQAPAAGGPTFIADGARLGRVLFSPGAVFTELNQRPSFWVPWIIVSVVYAALNFFQRPFQQRLKDLMLERAGRPVTPPSALGDIIGLVLTPVGLLVLCAISAGILYLIASGLGGETTYKRMLTVVIFTFPVTLIQTVLTVIVLNMRGVSSIAGPQDMMVSFGADLLLPGDSQIGYFVRILLMGISPLAIWSLAIQATGLTLLAKMGKGAAWTAAVIAYAVFLLVGAGLGAFGMKMAGG
jgi:hypothetical protein